MVALLFCTCCVAGWMLSRPVVRALRASGVRT
jgi:hypothetical protein